MISWQQDHRPVRSAAESAAARQLAISKLTIAAQEARVTGQAQAVDDDELHRSLDDEWIWAALADQYNCDFSGPYGAGSYEHDGKSIDCRGQFLVKPRKVGPPPLWKNVVIYDTTADGVAVVRSTIESWLRIRECPNRIVERPDLDLLEIRLQTDEPALELSEAHGGLFLRVYGLGDPSSREAFFIRATFDRDMLTFRLERPVGWRRQYAFL